MDNARQKYNCSIWISCWARMDDTHLMTRALRDSIGLAVVLRHVRVNEVHDVRADGHREDGRQSCGLLRLTFH